MLNGSGTVNYFIIVNLIGGFAILIFLAPLIGDTEYVV